MKTLSTVLFDLIILISWIAGIYVTQPLILKFVAFVFPPYAWYELIGAIITKYNLL
jgi:hypothetical protein